MDQSEGVSFGFFERHIEEFSISILPLIWFSYIDHIFGESCCFPLRLVPCVFITVLSLMGLLYIFDLHACRHVCVTLDHCVPWGHHSHTHTHTWAWLRLILTQRGQSPVGEPWVWAPSSWQQEAKNLITGWLLNYREQQGFFSKGARLAENE